MCHKKKYFISNNITKNKFLKQIGGSLDISGPTKIGYFFSDKFNKKIIIISDIHGDLEGSCENSAPSITRYIESINTNYPIDIFIETEIPHHHFLSKPSNKYLKLLKTSIPHNKDFITELVNFSFENYKSNPNKRFHFVDVRYDIFGKQSFINIYKLIEMIRNNIVQVENDNLSKVIHELITDYVASLFQIMQWIINPNFDNMEQIIPYYFYKEFELLYKSNHEILNLMVKILYKYIDDFLKLYLESLEYSNIYLINQMYTLGQIAGASITDFYTIARIMKSNEYNKCIIYGGAAHYSILKSYLESIGFECLQEIFSDESDFRCVKNVMNFDIFFESN